MEIKVNKIIEAHVSCSPNAFDCSGSRAEHGEDAANITWGNSLELAKRLNILDTEEKIQAAADHFLAYGAWSEKEVAAWSGTGEIQGKHHHSCGEL